MRLSVRGRKIWIGIYIYTMLSHSTQIASAQVVSDLAAAWKCDALHVIDLMRQVISDMRQLHFDARFWESVVVVVEQRHASGQPRLSLDFWEAMARTLARLCAEDLATMRLNFAQYPIVDDDPWCRSVDTGHGGRIIFRFTGAGRNVDMRAIPGASITVDELRMI